VVTLGKQGSTGRARGRPEAVAAVPLPSVASLPATRLDPAALHGRTDKGEPRMAVPLPILVDQIGAGLAEAAIYFWPQIMASAREHLVPWVDRNVPELAAPVRLAFQDLDSVAGGLRHAVSVAWLRLRTVLAGQTAQFVAAGSGEWVLRITSCLRNPATGGAAVIELVSEQALDWATLPVHFRAAGLDAFRDATIDIVRARDKLLAEPT
jgi:hypothetical protein